MTGIVDRSLVALAAAGSNGPVAANFTGGAGDDVLTGGPGSDTLDGRAGADSMTGGAGDDFYYVDNAGDVVVEGAAEGATDRLYTSVSYTLGAGVYVERMATTNNAGTGALNLTGNELANIIYGNAGANILDGKGGADTLVGLGGDDNYYVDNAADVVSEGASEGTNDRVFASLSYTLRAGSYVELLATTSDAGTGAINLTGNELANGLRGNAGANILDGKGGADTMAGLDGNDWYYIDNAGDTITGEGVGLGSNDRVFASTSWTMTAGAQIENIATTNIAGTAVINLTGNEFGQLLYGNEGNNILDGRGGADTMVGGGGSDWYYVDNAGDAIGGEGVGKGTNDRVFASTSWTLTAGAQIENVATTNNAGTAAINLTGNELANIIYGNEGDNVLNGAGGADTLVGLGGSDWYYVDNAGDSISGEGVGKGANDRVFAGTSWTLTAGAEIEIASTTDNAGTTAINLTGNELANIIYGNEGSNVLDGKNGADTLVGFGGNDSYHIDNTGDFAVETAAGGTDTIIAAISYALGDNFEKLTLSGSAVINATGNGLANVIIGNAAANIIDGGLGADTLTGGAGNDSFVFSAPPGAGNIDVITDFTAGQDKIVLSGGREGPFLGLQPPSLVSPQFRLGASLQAFDDLVATILYDPATGALRFDADGGGSGAAVQFATIATNIPSLWSSIVVTGTPNHSPVISSGATATVAENSAASTIVYQVAASDADGDSLSYVLYGADAGLATIDSLGAIRLIASPDFEARQTYNFSVTVNDAHGGWAYKHLTLSVTDIDDEGSGPTPLIAEVGSANDNTGQAQLVDRAAMHAADNPNLFNDSLPSVTIQGNIASPTDKDFYRIELHAGELLILDVDNSGGNLDAMLRVFGPGGSELAANDDPGAVDSGSDPHPEYGHNTDSFIRFRAPSDGVYYFSIEAFDDVENPTFGSYELNVSRGPVATPAQILEEDIDALISGYQWDHNNLSYGFPTNAGQYPAGIKETDEPGEFQAFLAAQQTATTALLQHVAGLTSLTFSLLSAAPGSANLRYAMSDDPDTAFAYYPTGSDMSGTAWFNKDDFNTPVRGNYAWVGILHETGHALGLKHGHEAPAISTDHDSHEYTVMTYRGYVGAPIDGYSNESFGYPQTLMMLDIAALQRMYGANFNTNSGNSTYAWSPTTGEMSINGVGQGAPGANRVFMTVWDGGGNDTYDLSSYSSQVMIDLRPGEWTQTSTTQRANLGDGHHARGNVANSLLYNDDPRSLIENAIGGGGPDGLTANRAANQLTGNGGVDTFTWASAGDAGLGSLADTITDFAPDIDRISFALLDLDPATGGHETLSFIGTDAFHHVAGEIRYQVIGSDAHLYVDVNGDGNGDMEIIVSHVMAIDFSVFWL